MTRNFELLTRRFFRKAPEVLAQDLLGKLLIREFGRRQILSGIIVETEAYLAEGDEAAHSYKGKTEQNKSLFNDAGTVYVHRIHRYFCMDIVATRKGIAGSVLLRALEPVEGIELMRENRERQNLQSLTTGPGKLCQAMSIDLSLDGIDLTQSDSPIRIAHAEINHFEITKSKRIGISKSTELELRFGIKENKYLSKRF